MKIKGISDIAGMKTLTDDEIVRFFFEKIVELEKQIKGLENVIREKKSRMIDAIQFSGDNLDEIEKHFPLISLRIVHYSGGVVTLYIVRLNGALKVDTDDWIIKGTKGEFYPCKPDIFEKILTQN